MGSRKESNDDTRTESLRCLDTPISSYPYLKGDHVHLSSPVCSCLSCLRVKHRERIYVHHHRPICTPKQFPDQSVLFTVPGLPEKIQRRVSGRSLLTKHRGSHVLRPAFNSWTDPE